LHDEDLDVDTDFCAMCGHDWCSVRISKEIQEFMSGKDPDSQPQRKAMPSPGLSQEQIRMLAHRGQKNECHSDKVSDTDEAQRKQNEQLVQLSVDC